MNPDQNIQNPPIKPQSSSKKKQGMLKTIISAIFSVLVITLLIVILIMQQGIANDTNAHILSLDKRIATLESEDKFASEQVNKDLYQAVFLTNQQTYFGKVTQITKDTIKIENIFYLNDGSVDKSGNSTSSSNVSLTKLGNEIHGPQDVMIIERKNVLFWENLKADSQVSKAIDQYTKQKPN
jgi:ABC-type lipoprotein release transport system permease subunit